MKGPGNRLKFVVRRGWVCPLCQRRAVTAGSVVFQVCTCRPTEADAPPVYMQLVDDPLPMPKRQAQP
jgi:hypothetical protein